MHSQANLASSGVTERGVSHLACLSAVEIPASEVLWRQLSHFSILSADRHVCPHFLTRTVVVSACRLRGLALVSASSWEPSPQGSRKVPEGRTWGIFVSLRVSPGLLALEVWGYNRFSLNSSVWVAYVSAALVGPGPGLEIMKRYEATGIWRAGWPLAGQLHGLNRDGHRG